MSVRGDESIPAMAKILAGQKNDREMEEREFALFTILKVSLTQSSTASHKPHIQWSGHVNHKTSV